MLLDAFRDRGWSTSGPAPSDEQLRLLQLPVCQTWEWFVRELEEEPNKAEPTSCPSLDLAPAKCCNWRLNGLSCMFHAWEGGRCLMPMCETCGAQCQDEQSKCVRCASHLCSSCKGKGVMAEHYTDGNCRQCN
jgi:hypothetical protein